MEPSPRASLNLPSAIIIAAALIAVAIIWVKKPADTAPVAGNQGGIVEINMRPVSDKDHIFGNPDAPVKIVEYSDTACPFCKMFHPTMKQLMSVYGPSGQVAWVYRHYPLDKPDPTGRILHPNAGYEAQALECAAALGGNDKFWAYTNRLYEITPAVTPETPGGLDRKELPNIAGQVGLNVVSFNECLSSGRFRDKVEADYLDGVNAGVSGTPYSVIITPGGTKIPLVGAQSYSTLKAAIDAVLPENR